MMPELAVLLCLLHVLAAAPPDDSREKPKSPAQEYEALVEEFEDVGGARQFAGRFFGLAEKHPHDPAAVDALVWILQKRRRHSDATRALELLGERHLKSPAMDRACRSIARVPATSAEGLLRRLLEKSPHAAVRGRACYHLADLLERQASVVDQLTQEPEQAARLLQYFGKEYGKHLLTLERAKLDRNMEEVYELMTRSFADVRIDDQRLGDLAETALFRLRHLSVGRVAVDIKGEDPFGREFQLSDFRGKVVMLSFWGHW